MNGLKCPHAKYFSEGCGLSNSSLTQNVPHSSRNADAGSERAALRAAPKVANPSWYAISKADSGVRAENGSR